MDDIHIAERNFNINIIDHLNMVKANRNSILTTKNNELTKL